MIRRTLVVGRALILYALMVAVGVTFLFPFLWMLSTSLKTDAQVFTNPPIWIPNPVEFGNYVDALVMVPTARYFVNTLIITVVPMCAVVISSAIVAFAFARLEWPGRNVLFAVLLSTMMLPGQVTMIPLFVLFHRMGWTNTFKPLVVPSFFASAFYVFLLRQFFMGIPKEFDEAATMDGATPPLIWWRIIMPLAGPALAAVAVFSFVGNWNSFMEPLIYLRTAKKWPLALGLVAFRDEYYTQWQHLMAYSVIVMLPCLIVFFFSQRYFIQGITLSGLKG
ncbi:MAG: carbohydrate ABC transporter permease [Anaerolineae bacterium]|nr:carbohydrate ABC transporter permease [Anaerolineae bacterium]